jgi:glycosyltransferase involved in cell wall biosynthesis
VHEIIAGLRALGWTVELFATHAGGASAGTTLLAGRAGLPVFQEVNGQMRDLAVTYPWLKPALAPIEGATRFQLAKADHVFAVTDGLADWVRAEAGHDRVRVVPNTANTTLFTPHGPRGEVHGPYVIFVGGLVGWHGITAILAAARHAAWPKGVRLVIVGDGIHRDQVAAAAREGSVVWLGRRPYDEIPGLLRGALAALCIIEDPDGRSATGVAPLKLYEAMACGVPVIVSDLPFQGDLVRREGAGVVVPVAQLDQIAASVADLAATVRELAADPVGAKAMGEAGARHVHGHASWRMRAEAIARIMDATIEARGARR